MGQLGLGKAYSGCHDAATLSIEIPQPSHRNVGTREMRFGVSLGALIGGRGFSGVDGLVGRGGDVLMRKGGWKSGRWEGARMNRDADGVG